MNSATILVVDDEPQIRRVMKHHPRWQGYTVLEARSGEEALEKLRTERPDLILLDVNMPGIGGLEACREIRSRSDVPIIMLTVRNSERDKVQRSMPARTTTWSSPSAPKNSWRAFAPRFAALRLPNCRRPFIPPISRLILNVAS